MYVQARCCCVIVTKLEFSQQILTSSGFKISRKSIQWEQSCSMQTDREMGMMKQTAAFHICPNTPKIQENTDVMTVFFKSKFKP
jgi:hypothetical protein